MDDEQLIFYEAYLLENDLDSALESALEVSLAATSCQNLGLDDHIFCARRVSCKHVT